MRGIGVFAVGLLLVAPLGCSDRSDRESLREGLSGIPADTVAIPEVAIDTQEFSTPVYQGPAALPDTAGLPTLEPGPAGAPGNSTGATQAPPATGDTTRGGLRPTEPRDTRPWIPGTSPLPAGWTIEPSDVLGAGRPVTVTGVRAARNAEFDRIVFEFQGEQLPGYHLEYLADPARQCGSGRRVRVDGDARLLVRLHPSVAHSEDGRRTTVPDRVETDLETVPEVRRTCDFEGVVAWVLGLDQTRPYRVISLHNPARLVVDVRR
jgi:hypothetical protein